ncbi:uncharacterized protein BJ171DRAFT_568708 [Polychytrium aggregatum]|uniref:uncharacterized protein n=1 Tax=Polychytrium aggregatum TaxID=110093 RepID=UPI0022FEB75D|nr:uncharacterized protein BJ171DRAFT_568708 [Polychytrium aggregatum]KAI9203567.1 hypothetical protein BJ171DRAFT_568708 [Polychytrium aggregatum]
MAESTLIQEDLARFDLLTILITNDAFIRAASSSLLAKLLRVSKQTRAILDTEEVRERLLFPTLGITPEFLFKGVDPSIDRLKVAQGLLCYALRQNQHRPTNSSMLAKENELWSEVHRDRPFFDRVQRYCQVTDPAFHFPEDARPNGSKQPSVEEMITIAEGQDFRFKWPLEGMPNVLPSLTRLDLSECSELKSLKGMPEMPKLETILLPPSIESLEGMPKELPSLTRLDLSGCTELKSLKGISEMPKLETILLPKSTESLGGLPRELPSLKLLTSP